MKAKPLLRKKLTDEDGDLMELVVWQVPQDSRHPEGVRYRMAFILRGHEKPAVLYDNHHPKGHHRHIGGLEEPYEFSGVRELILDFEKDVAVCKKIRRETR